MIKFLIPLLVVVLNALSTVSAHAEKSPYDWAFIQLDYIRQEKVGQLDRFTKKIHTLASQASTDKTIASFFDMNRYYHNLCKSQKAPASLSNDIEKMRQHFNSYYIKNYFVFYDILFIDMAGSVFYTLRKEADININMSNSGKILGRLQEAILNKPDQEVFIDYYEYTPSSEPAAFFIEPVYKKGVQAGWIILQCSINSLNSIFSATDDIGQTGETFLVNRKGLMLTESYFKGHSTILKERLDDRNIKAKFNEKKGHRVVTDYRGEIALSSFEVVEFLGTSWLVVAKIDKDEITTQHYKQHSKYYRNLLMKHLGTLISQPAGKDTSITHYKNALRVDMDEFLKAENNEVLETWGVSTCTAVLASVPQKFGYLAHISPKDKIYNNNDTNLLAQITKKIKNFDIYPFEKREVIFIVIAPHLDGVGNIIKRLIEDGFLLSQIRVAYNSKAKAAAVVYNYSNNDLIITWSLTNAHGTQIIHGLKNTTNLGKTIEKMVSNGINIGS
ncbi:MAG: hypothetical protein GY699_15565 [Desulfobacteraceae bacterium]|nr:hypothetical protein [Desulfobacteraceae bacterium]